MKELAQIKYVWKFIGEVDGQKRLLTPHADPMLYEYAIDFYYDTPEQAYAGLQDWGVADEAVEDGWVLCREALTPVEQCDPRQAGYDEGDEEGD
jgi:hypothetical protein